MSGEIYIRHDGFGPTSIEASILRRDPSIRTSTLLYAGGGVTQMVAVTDAIFEPLAARQVLSFPALGHPGRQE